MDELAKTDAPLAAPSRLHLALFFLKLGTVAFGGPAAHVAMMQDELVKRRRWIAEPDFLDLFAVSNILPGPSSTELAIFIGYRLGGLPGLVLAGVCFILPAFFIVAALAWAYVRYGHLPVSERLLYAVKPVVIAIVLQALWRLGRSTIKTRQIALLGGAALAASFAGVPPLLVLGASGAAMAVPYALGRRGAPGSAAVALSLATRNGASGGAALVCVAGATAVTPGALFLVFAKIGALVFGSGYVLLAFLRSEFIASRHWLSETQLLDAVAIGQVTPGPVFTTATFIGYLLGGSGGAVAATVGIFAPAFVCVAAAGPLVKRLRASRLAGRVLDGLNAASLALMAMVLWQLARAAIVDATTAVLLIVSAVLLLVYQLNSTWIVGGSAVVGLVLTLLRHGR